MGLFNSSRKLKKKYSLEYWDQYMDTFYSDDNGKLTKNHNFEASFSDSLIHQFPYNLENNKGQKTRHIMQSMIAVLRKKTGLRHIYGGYVLVTPKIIESEDWNQLLSLAPLGLLVFGQDTEFFEKEVQKGNKHCLAYYTVPIDDNDFLIERPSWEGRDFMDIVGEFHGVKTWYSGSVINVGLEGKLRPVRFSFDLEKWTFPEKDSNL